MSNQLMSRIPRDQAQTFLHEPRPGTILQAFTIQLDSLLQKQLGGKPIVAILGVPLYFSK